MKEKLKVSTAFNPWCSVVLFKSWCGCNQKTDSGLPVDCNGSAGGKLKSGALQRNSMQVFRSEQFLVCGIMNFECMEATLT
jgi:hypothetical protein